MDWLLTVEAPNWAVIFGTLAGVVFGWVWGLRRR